MKKKFMSKPMKILIIVLSAVFISTYIISAVLLFNSNYSLSNYFDDFNISFDSNHFNFGSNRYSVDDSRDLSLSDTLSNISISTSSIDILAEPSDSDNIRINIMGKAREHSTLDSLFTINDSNSSELSISQKSNRIWGEHLVLKIYIPTKYNKDITIQTTSGDTTLSQLTLGTINITSTSGDVDLDNISCTESKMNLTSGDVEATANLGNVDIASTSGDIDLTLDKLGSSNKISSVSGDVDLSTTDTNYSIIFETTSGDLDNGSSQSYNKSHNTYTMKSGNESNKFDVTTTSGDFSFMD